MPDLNHCDPRRPGQQWAVRNVVRADGQHETTSQIVLVGGGDKDSDNQQQRQQLCFGLAPVANAKFCGGLTVEVESWLGTALPAKRCVNAMLLACDEPTTLWKLEPAGEVLERNAHYVLRTEPLPPLVYE